MGQVHVVWVRAEALPTVWVALGRAGFAVTLSEAADPHRDLVARCSRGNRELEIGIDHESNGVFIVVAYPPYSCWPWRFLADARFFDDLTSTLDVFNESA
jgi:hypothetical protein